MISSASHTQRIMDSPTPSAGGGGSTLNGTPPGNHTITINADTFSNTTGTADAVLNIPLTVKLNN